VIVLAVALPMLVVLTVRGRAEVVAPA